MFALASRELRRSSNDAIARFGQALHGDRMFDVSRIAQESRQAEIISGARRTSPSAGLYTIGELGATNYDQPNGGGVELQFASASDTSTGTGAQQVKLELLDTSNVASIQTFSSGSGAGAHTVAVPGTYNRVNKVWVSVAGSNGANVGNITVRGAGAGSNYVRIGGASDLSRSQELRHTIPAGQVGILEAVKVSGDMQLPYVVWLYTNQAPDGTVTQNDMDGVGYVSYAYRLVHATIGERAKILALEQPVLFGPGTDLEIFIETFVASAITISGIMQVSRFNLLY